MPDWYSKTPDETINILQTDLAQGLSPAEIERRRAEAGVNELQEKPGQTVWQMLWSQCTEFLVLLLLAAAVISLLLGEITDAIVIFIVVLVNAVTGVVQEFKAEKSLAALKTLSAPHAKVLRAGRTQQIPARDLVPGDIILLDAGDFIPADARLIDGANLKVEDRKSTRLNSSHVRISYAVFCLKKK